MDKILSIIVPAYNMEAYLPKCLGSLVIDDKELLQKLDVIVVNDGSKDRTSEIAHEFELKYPGVFRVIDKSNGHYGSCVNVGLDRAMGTYAFVLDADDYMCSSSFQEYVRIVEGEATSLTGGVDLIVSNYIHVSITGNCVERANLGLTENAVSLNDKAALSWPLDVHSIAYKVANLRKIGYRQLEGAPYTDTEWMINPMITVRRLRYFDKVVVCYLIGRAGQTMGDTIFAEHFQQVIDVVSSIVRTYATNVHNAVDEAKDYYRRIVVDRIALVYRTCIFGWSGHRVIGNLSAFDEELRQIPELYELTDSLNLPSRRYTFNFVHEWRKWKNTWTPRFILMKMYIVVARVLGVFSRHSH